VAKTKKQLLVAEKRVLIQNLVTRMGFRQERNLKFSYKGWSLKTKRGIKAPALFKRI
jgi:hypothetical protein